MKVGGKLRVVLGIFFDPDDVGDMFLRNAGFSPKYMAL
jgi:hypothetical protein